MIQGSAAVFGEQMAGGGVSAKKKIDEIIENLKTQVSKGENVTSASVSQIKRTNTAGKTAMAVPKK